MDSHLLEKEIGNSFTYNHYQGKSGVWKYIDNDWIRQN